jgi:DNA-binding XRE family transcriptional regulator
MRELVKRRNKLGLDRKQMACWLKIHYMALRKREFGEVPASLKLKEKYSKILDEYNIFLNKIKD